MSGSNGLPAGPWINLGSGPVRCEGWISVDGSWQAALGGRPRIAGLVRRLTGRTVGEWPTGIVRRDLRKGLPFDDASVAVVFTSHTLEHLYRSEALAVLRDVRRVLKPGGVCRAIVPDLAALVRWYGERAAIEPEAASDQLLSMMLLRPREASERLGPLSWYRRATDFDAHKWMYDGPGLLRLFKDAGFEQPARQGHLESAIDRERLAAVERADRIVDGAGVCVEAFR